jgi:hypothetical protein
MLNLIPRVLQTVSTTGKRRVPFWIVTFAYDEVACAERVLYRYAWNAELVFN